MPPENGQIALYVKHIRYVHENNINGVPLYSPIRSAKSSPVSTRFWQIILFYNVIYSPVEPRCLHCGLVGGVNNIDKWGKSEKKQSKKNMEMAMEAHSIGKNVLEHNCIGLDEISNMLTAQGEQYNIW